MKFASRVKEITPSVTLAIAAKAKAMKAQGLDVCSFSAGEPDFDTPIHIKEAAKKALDEGKTKYGPTTGEVRLREAIARKLCLDNNLSYQAENIIVTNGGKHSLYNLMMAIIEPGDEVIIPSPYWLSYPEMVRLADGVPVIVNTSGTGYKLIPDMLLDAITDKTKLLILNSPNNPTGIVYSPDEIRALAEIVVSRDLLVVSDEIYEKIMYGSASHLSIGSINSDIASRTIVSSGFAKAYSMTGWRIGYLAAGVDLIKVVNTIQGHSTSNVCTFAQYGAIAALEGDQSIVEEMRLAFAKRREIMLEGLSLNPSLSCAKPDGAFYLFVNISNTGLRSMEFCDRLLSQYYVAAIPGAAFGADDHIRLSYATDAESIKKGMDRLRMMVDSL